MKVGKIIGSIISTRKHDSLVGYKLMVVEIYKEDKKETIVAADTVGAGIGEIVLISEGSSGRQALSNVNSAIDSVIVGILDDENNLGLFIK